MFDKFELWGLSPVCPRPDVALPGSPERCVRRVAGEVDGRVLVLERLRPGQHRRRERIAHLLYGLQEVDLPVLEYLRLPGGGFVAESEGEHWQLSVYVPGDVLPMPEYVDHEERGESLGRFLAQLSKYAPAIATDFPDDAFRLETYVDELMATISEREPQLGEALQECRRAAQPLFDAWDDLPRTLAHGDLHPLNIIWRGREVAAAIDWEFAGIRPALYDTANCLGCVCIEDPSSMSKGLAPALLATLRDAGLLDAEGLRLLPHLVLALRFAWMSEWLRRKDSEMIDLERHLMILLARNLGGLTGLWAKMLGFAK